MTELLPTFEYEGDKVTAHFEGQVIASGDTFAKVAQTAEQHLSALKTQRKAAKKQAKREAATHIITPNGLKGEVLSRVAGVWGDEITVRFDNGQIRRFETAAGDGLKYKKVAKAEPSNPREAFEQRLAAEYAPNREGLTARINELADVRREAGAFAASSPSVAEQKALHSLVLAAEAEQAEIREALAHLDAVDAENAAPAAPKYAAVEQVSFGHGAKDNWLEVVAQEMVAESEAEDFDKLLSDGPTLLVSSLDDGAVANLATVREIALSHVTAKTAGFQGAEVEAYRERFVAAAELARRQEWKYRQKSARKEAKAVEASVTDLPSDFLFGA